ncbi:hypothetical protein [Pseudomonas baetica]|uniref:hypothetical protein n=1 Tax=Pseudomonas baetica TaxID=674054 RepID=UPI00240503B6|nr:hypothetical protein [Pseudomonas baetica]MDF9778939.1 hypothetical protein [Pseudomonas baetica]
MRTVAAAKASPITLHTLYARREPTTDAFVQAIGVKGKKDLVLYEDKACTKPASRYMWTCTRPTRAKKRVIHNCCPYNLEWLPDLKAA